MDKEQRTRVDEEFRDVILDQQKRHISNLEQTEQAYAFNLDAYTEVYGGGALNGADKSARVLWSNWVALLESLQSAPITVVIRTIKELKQGCYGFGAEAQYDLHAEIILAIGQADIIGDFVEDGVSLQISGAEVYRLEGAAFVQEPSQSLASSSDYSNENISNGSAQYLRIMDADSKIISVDEVDDLYRQFEVISASDTGGLAMRLYSALDTLKTIELSN